MEQSPGLKPGLLFYPPPARPRGLPNRPITGFPPRIACESRLFPDHSILVARDRAGKPASTFPDHAVASARLPTAGRAAVAQLVRAPDCGSGGRWFESTQLYQATPSPSDFQRSAVAQKCEPSAPSHIPASAFLAMPSGSQSRFVLTKERRKRRRILAACTVPRRTPRPLSNPLYLNTIRPRGGEATLAIVDYQQEHRNCRFLDRI
jgi:hypothetical protein